MRVLHLEFQKCGYGQEVHDAVTSLSSDQGDRLLSSILAVLRRSWFSRIWAFQEAVLSGSRTIVCGDVSLQCSVIANFLDTLKHFQLHWLLFSSSEQEWNASSPSPREMLIALVSIMLNTRERQSLCSLLLAEGMRNEEMPGAS